MQDKMYAAINKRKVAISVIIALIMAAPMIAGNSEVSYAASVSGAKAVNSGFKMISISWNAVKVELPQEESAETTEPATPAEQEDQVDVEEPVDLAGASEPAEPTNSGADSDSITDQNVESADSINSNNLDEPGDSAAESAEPDENPTDPVADMSVDVEDSVDTTIDQAGQAARDKSDEPVMELAAASDPVPVYDVITYKVYRATSKSGKYKLIKTTKSTSYTNKGLAVGKKYYYKVVAYRSSGEKCGTSAVVSATVAKQVTANLTLLMKGNAAFNYRIAAKQKLYQYDILQGACANSGYAYLTLYNNKVERCKIVKVKLSDLSIIKVSATLPIYHGNTLTYNTREKRIVATCCTSIEKAKFRVVLINPKTLKVVSTKNIKLTKKVKNLPQKVRTKNNGFSAIAYNEKHNCYVARLRDNGNVIILNKDLKPLRYNVLKGKKTGLLEQGIETVDNYIYDVRSFKGKYNYCMVTVHTMAGKYVGQMSFPSGTAPKKELECIFHNGKQFYAGFYYSTVQTDGTKKKRVKRVNLIQQLNNL